MVSNEYIAGFFDGEGCINITIAGKNKQPSLRMIVVNTDITILEEIQLTYGGRIPKSRRIKEDWKPFRCIQFDGWNAYSLLVKIQPYLKVKKRQADLAIEFWNFQHSSRDSRLDMILAIRSDGKNRVSFKKKPEVMEKEFWFKNQMNNLNRKGSELVN